MVPDVVPLLATVMASEVPVVLEVFKQNGCPEALTLKVSVSPNVILIGGSFPENAPESMQSEDPLAVTSIV